jgi:hypothetical protein
VLVPGHRRGAELRAQKDKHAAGRNGRARDPEESICLGKGSHSRVCIRSGSSVDPSKPFSPMDARCEISERSTPASARSATRVCLDQPTMWPGCDTSSWWLSRVDVHGAQAGSPGSRFVPARVDVHQQEVPEAVPRGDRRAAGRGGGRELNLGLGRVLITLISLTDASRGRSRSPGESNGGTARAFLDVPLGRARGR